MTKYLLIAVLIVLLGWHQASSQNPTIEMEKIHFQNDTTYLIKADPQNGFHFDYYLYIPRKFDTKKENTLLVESTNTGLSDSIEQHLQGAKYAASKSSVGNFVANKLSIPLLVPVFPRSETRWQMYTHAFDSETFTEKESEYERLDLQLIAMVEDAKAKFKASGIKIQDQFFITGFSASGSFANRFSILHPQKLKAVCAGGLNSILILPMESYNGEKLNFPIGIANVESVTAKKVELDHYRNLPQFWFMGENDSNDAAQFEDAYTPEERRLIFEILGEEMMPKRWENVQKIYEEKNIPASFKIYKAIGHGTDLKINNDISAFFENHL